MQRSGRISSIVGSPIKDAKEHIAECDTVPYGISTSRVQCTTHTRMSTNHRATSAREDEKHAQSNSDRTLEPLYLCCATQLVAGIFYTLAR